MTARRATAVLLALGTTSASADPVGVVNALRTRGCEAVPAAGTTLIHDAELDEVARSLSRGDSLETVFERSDYRAARSTSLHARGPRDDAALTQLLAERNCASVNDPRYEHIGIFERRDETWIVLAAPRAEPPPLVPMAVAQRVLELVNAARGEPRRCGRELYPAVAPVTASALLDDVASAHSQDMAARAEMGHRGSDGTLAGDRITRAGYAWRASAENVAAGQRDADAVVAAWLDSPGHCANLMGTFFTEMGIAFALAPEQDPAIYWTQVFAAPR